MNIRTYFMQMAFKMRHCFSYLTSEFIFQSTQTNIASRFEQIAQNLLNNFVIRKGKKLYRFIDIEFYYNITDNGNITFERVTEAGEWFNHDWGVDLCFKSNESAFGGILIRSIECIDDVKKDEFINGPIKCRQLLFQFDALGDTSTIPTLEYLPRENMIEPVSVPRWNISEKQLFRFCIPRELWTEHKGYNAYPWDYKGNLKNKL